MHMITATVGRSERNESNSSVTGKRTTEVFLKASGVDIQLVDDVWGRRASHEHEWNTEAIKIGIDVI